MAGHPASISCIQAALLLASHCVFGEGSGSIQGCSEVGQPALVLTAIVRVMRNQTDEVLVTASQLWDETGQIRTHLRRDSEKIQSSHVMLGCIRSS